MANSEHLVLVSQGVDALNKWQREHPNSELDLVAADFSFISFGGADLTGANLSEADLVGTGFRGADLRGAQFSFARLNHADFSGANLRNASLIGAYMASANLSRANFSNAIVDQTIFADVDLRDALGLEEVRHQGPSEISISTIYKSEGRIPEVFLRGCGVPEEFITQILVLVAALQPVQFHSCFISYSTKDEEFARRLHERMRAAGLRVWFAPEDIKGGRKLYEQLDQAIQVHDRLLLVLSESSMRSEWVMTEMRRARRAEVRENRRKLFPIRLVDYDALREWECFDADTGKDLTAEVREYFIPDFSDWKSHDEFENAFGRLL